MENNVGWHGKAPNDEEYATAMAAYHQFEVHYYLQLQLNYQVFLHLQT